MIECGECGVILGQDEDRLFVCLEGYHCGVCVVKCAEDHEEVMEAE